jgi:hypothetical protein
MMWSNFVNFFANLRALRQVMEMGDSRRVAWDKTTHEFPALATPARTPLGHRLVEKGLITEQQLEQAITSPVRRRLGRELLLRGWLTSEQLVQTLAEQLDLPWAPLNPFKLDRQLIDKLRASWPPTTACCRWRKTATPWCWPAARSARFRWGHQPPAQAPGACPPGPQGRVTLGLRYHYPSPWQKPETRRCSRCWSATRTMPTAGEVCTHQVMLGTLLQVRGMVPATLFNQALIDFDPERQSLGEHLIERGIITEACCSRRSTNRPANSRPPMTDPGGGMKPRFSLTVASLLLCTAALAAPTAPMTDFQRFTSYPFMERGYREAQRDNWAEVERLTRHVLKRVPNNNEARALLAEALAHQRRYKDAEAIADDLDDNPEHADALLELRLTWIEQDPPPASQVDWLAQRRQPAHPPVAGLQPEPGQVRRRTPRPGLAQPVAATRRRHGTAPGPGTSPNSCATGGNHRATATLGRQGPVAGADWQRLANAYIQQVDEQGLTALLASAPPPGGHPGTPGHGRTGHRHGPQPAGQRWLQSLPPNSCSSPNSASNCGSGPRRRRRRTGTRLSNELQRPAWKPSTGCRARTRHWPASNWANARPMTMSAPTPSSGNACTATRLAHRNHARPQWEQRYRQSGDLAALEQASFMWLQQGQADHARQLLEQAYDRRQGRLTPALLQRLGNLYARNDGPLNSHRMQSPWCHGWMPPPAPNCSAAWPRTASAMPCAGQSRPTPPRPASTAPGPLRHARPAR